MPINFAIKLAATVALTAVEMGLQALHRTKGPRPDELQVSTAEYGTPLPKFLGERKFACPIIWAKDLEVVKHSSKVKGGGKQTTYGTLATFGVAISDCYNVGPIDKILKIWMDETLVYDVTGSGPVSSASAIGVDVNSIMRIYTGAEDQPVDPAYEAYCEDKYGVSGAPAFRGVSTIVFDGLPCDNFGNRVPTISVLAVTLSAPAHPFATIASPTTNSSANFVSSPSGQWMAMVASAGQNFWFDIPSATYIGAGSSPGFFTGSISSPSLADDGTAYFMGDRLNDPHLGNNYFLCQVPPVGVPVLTEANPTTLSFGSTRALQSASGLVVLTSYATATGYIDFATHVDHAQSLRDSCIDADGNVAKLFQPSGSSSDFTIECAGGTFTITGSGSRSGPSSAYICYASAYDQFVVLTDGYFYAIDPSDGLVRSSTAATWGAAIPKNNAEQNPNLTTIWNYASGFQQYSLEDGSLLQSLATSDWTSAVSNAHWTYDPVSDAIWTRSSTSGQPIKILYLNRAASAGVTLEDIVSAQCDGCGMTDYDASALTQIVDGFSWTRSDGKSQMQPLLDIHDVDARPHGFNIEFLPRGGAASGTILTEDFAKSDPRYAVKIAQDTDLPKMVRVNFADIDNDQEPNNVLSPFTSETVDSQRDETIDLSTYAADPDTAQQLSDRYIKRQWNSAESIELTLTAQQLALEPGDRTTLSLDGILQAVRLDKQTFAADDTIKCTFVRDEIGVSVLNDNTTGPPLVRDPDTIYVPSPVRGFVIDAPLRQDDDADTRPLLYDGAGSYASLAFPGVQVWEETGSGTSAAYDQLVDSIGDGATWGLCTSTLADVPSPWLWDRGNTLTISLQNGLLTNASEADIDADPELNLILVGSTAGWEYLNFTTATLNGDGSYTLSGLKRGRRGTEWMCGAHGSGEAVILASSLSVEEMGLDDVGDALSFKVQAIGRSLDSTTAIDLNYTGATLKPYAPARIKWTTDGTDMFGEIVRRTRVGGSWVGGSTIPLSENSEAYEVDILDGSGAVLRTITVSGTNTFTYTGAQIASDGGTVGVPPSYNAYQISDAVGRGYALAA